MQALIYLLLLFQTPEVPYKPAAEFDLKVDMQFKLRNAPPTFGTEIPVGTASRTATPRYDGAAHAWIILNLSFLHLSEKEVRYVVTDAQSAVLYNRKAKPGTVIKLEVGFVDDIKDKLKNCFYNVVLSGPDRQPTSRIRISIDSDGLYLVNGEKSGKF